MPHQQHRALMLLALLPPAALAVAAVAFTSLVEPQALRVALDALAVVALVAAAWRASLVTEEADEEAEPAVSAAAATLQRIAGDRRRPTMDRDTGMLAEWYFRLRVEEELARAQRYGQRFTLLRLSDGDHVHGLKLAAILRTSLRSIDLAGSVGERTCVLLPNTDRAGAEPVAERIRALVPGAEIEMTECPAESATLDALLGEDQWMTGQQPWPEAPAA